MSREEASYWHARAGRPARLRALRVLLAALIGRATNIRIGGRPPSVYLAEIAGQLGEPTLEKALASHNLPGAPDGSLRSDRYEEFLEWRRDRLGALLAQVTQG